MRFFVHDSRGEIEKLREIESLLGLAGSPLEMRLCASNHGDQMNLTVIIKHKQHDTTVLNTKNT